MYRIAILATSYNSTRNSSKYDKVTGRRGATQRISEGQRCSSLARGARSSSGKARKRGSGDGSISA